MRTLTKTLAAILSTTVWLTSADATASTQRDDDLFQLSLEQLLNTEVSGASKFSQKSSEAPASVSVVSAQEIKAYGWRNITELLNSVRGVYGSYDRNYSYVGVRGFSRPGDYNTRILLVIDGHPLNDMVYSSMLAGNEFPLDLEMIERVEFIRGSGSSLYGSNAFFGVINIITKKGAQAEGFRAGLETGSQARRRATLSWGKNEDERDILLSASAYGSHGQDLYFPEFDSPASNNGLAFNLDAERDHRLFGKYSSGGLTLEAFHSSRTKAIPTASYAQVFNQSGSQTTDAYTVLAAAYSKEMAKDYQIDINLAYLQYDYSGKLLYDYPPITVNQDKDASAWWSGEVRLLAAPITGHRLLGGMAFTYSPKTIQQNYDDAGVYLDDHRTKRTWGVYMQDEISLGERWLLNLGVRHDREPDFKLQETHPRVALVYKASSDTTLKLLHGSAYRAPSYYEAYYVTNAASSKSNPALKAETIRSTEAIAEYSPQHNLKLTAEAYTYDTQNLINLENDPSDNLLHYVNSGAVSAHGLSLETEYIALADTRLRFSYAWQQTEDQLTGNVLSNSPQHLAKLNVQTPLWNTGLSAGLEVQYQSRIIAADGLPVSGFAIANLTLNAFKLAPGLALSASLYNLFDRSYAYTASDVNIDSLGRSLHSIQQDGRNFRLHLDYQF